MIRKLIELAKSFRPRTDRPIALLFVLVLVVGGVGALELARSGPNSDAAKLDDQDGGSQNLEASVAPDEERIERKKEGFERAKELVDTTGYVNADEVSLEKYVGEKVILIEFWTYSCYNCQATHPYVNEWYKKYEDEGLVIIGVHTPEFDFEKKKGNVRKAVKEAGIEYPVVMDNNYATWRAYDQQYWPTRYLIDVDGFIRYKHIGEGAYNETEQKIQELLEERDAVVGEEKASSR